MFLLPPHHPSGCHILGCIMEARNGFTSIAEPYYPNHSSLPTPPTPRYHPPRPHALPGTISMCILYASTGASCIAAPAVLRRLSPKWTMVLSWCLYSAYFLTNLDTAHWTTAWLAALLIGITSGPLFSAQVSG